MKLNSDELARRRARLRERFAVSAETPAPEISVVVPTYNRTDTLAWMLDSYARQTLPVNRFELILVDNDSNPDTVELLECLPDLPIQLRYLWIAPNRGPGPARNAGILEARGRIVLLGTDDTQALPTLLTEHLRAHHQYPDRAVAILGHIDWDPASPINSLMRYTTEVSGNQYAFFAIQDPTNCEIGYFYGSNLSLKREFLVEGDHLFSPAIVYGYEDVELGHRLKQDGLRIVYHKPARVFHRHFYDLTAFAHRMYRVGEAAIAVSKLHPELSQMVGVSEQWRANPVDPVSLKEIVRSGQEVAEELDGLDLAALNLAKVGGKPLGTMLDELRNNIYHTALTQSYQTGIVDARRALHE